MVSEQGSYFERLMQMVNAAENVPFRQVQLCKWEPQPNDCHENVDYWVSQTQDSKAVRGWLFWPPDQFGRYMFMAHSVIEESGGLVDITPIDQNTSRSALLFLRHPGTQDEFNAIKTVWSQVIYPTVPWESCISVDFPPSQDEAGVAASVYD